MFAKAGAQLALADIHAEGLKEVANLIAKAGGTAIIKKTDVSKEDEVKALIALALKSYSKIDILCNIAGVAEEITGLDQQDRSAWHRVYDVNVMGVVYTTKHVCLHMQGRKCGAIVNISSVAGIRSGAAETRGVGMFAHPPPEERQANIEYTLKVFRTFSGSGFPLDEEWHRKIAAQAYGRAFYPEGVARQLAAILTQKNRKPELGSVSVPTLVIHGADDPLVPAAIDRKTQLTAIGGLFASFSAIDPFGFYRIIK